ncbi:hypothetical protein [Zavarzinella formosa]|uniref:hypothetical protein n=1 Tax=Zavarzinella formosa TaxID=360055 RepID=UPI0003128344|nr:hypothetical protein [Zavarzinella formosa]
MTTVAKACLAGLRMGLLAALMAWAAAAPLVWIVRDGLGPDAVDSAGIQSVSKFAVMWGLPALTLAVAVAGLTLVQRRLGANAFDAAIR